MNYSVDLISDLNLQKSEIFEWTGKPTSLFCIICGNLSSDISVIKRVLEHLSTIYRGVFYIDGKLEHNDLLKYSDTIDELAEICKGISNVIYMHNHVVVLNNIAFVGVNGWYYNNKSLLNTDRIIVNGLQNEDLAYLSSTIKNLQEHSDVKKVIIFSACVPSEHLLYNSKEIRYYDGLEIALALVMDRQHIVTHWLYGGTTISGDLIHNGRRFINNPKDCIAPYWPKRIII